MTWFKRIRRWIIWIGGWEKPNGEGWDLFIEYRTGGKLRRRLMDPTPISLFGHRITFQGWGINVRTPWGYLCWSWRPENQAYLSPNATPWAATKFFWGGSRYDRERAASRQHALILVTRHWNPSGEDTYTYEWDGPPGGLAHVGKEYVKSLRDLPWPVAVVQYDPWPDSFWIARTDGRHKWTFLCHLVRSRLRPLKAWIIRIAAKWNLADVPEGCMVDWSHLRWPWQKRKHVRYADIKRAVEILQKHDRKGSGGGV